MAIGFIGTGRMGAMLVRVLLGAAHPVEEEVWASNRSPEKLEELTWHYQRLRTGDNIELARECRTLFLCVRPDDTAAVLEELRNHLTEQHLLISITNVVELDRLAALVPCRTAKAMIPSFTQFVRAGVSLLIPGPRCTPTDVAYLHDLLDRVSRIYEITESQSRAATNVVSCGPAFLCASARSGRLPLARYSPIFRWKIGKPWSGTARAAADLPKAGVDGREILEEVSTPGGMTYEGLQVMDATLPAMWREVMSRMSQRERALKMSLRL